MASTFAEFRAMNEIVKALEKNWGKLKPDSRDWMRKRLDELVAEPTPLDDDD